jgi:ribosomal protein L34E
MQAKHGGCGRKQPILGDHGQRERAARRGDDRQVLSSQYNKQCANGQRAAECGKKIHSIRQIPNREMRPHMTEKNVEWKSGGMGNAENCRHVLKLALVAVKDGRDERERIETKNRERDQ